MSREELPFFAARTNIALLTSQKRQKGETCIGRWYVFDMCGIVAVCVCYELYWLSKGN